MRSRRTVSAALAAVLILAAAVRPRPAAASSTAGQEALQATVTTVYDGDTVKVRIAGRTDERVRLIGVDSPELDDAREKVRLMAFLAKRFAFQRLFRTQVELLPGPEERDAYGRLLAFVRTADGGIFNVTLVRGGSKSKATPQDVYGGLLGTETGEMNGGFGYVQLSITVGTAASLISAILLGFYGRYQPVSHIATVVQTVN